MPWLSNHISSFILPKELPLGGPWKKIGLGSPLLLGLNKYMYISARLTHSYALSIWNIWLSKRTPPVAAEMHPASSLSSSSAPSLSSSSSPLRHPLPTPAEMEESRTIETMLEQEDMCVWKRRRRSDRIVDLKSM